MGSAPDSKCNPDIAEEGWIGGAEEGRGVLEETGKGKEGPVHHTTAVQTPFIPTTLSSLLYLCKPLASTLQQHKTKLSLQCCEGSEVMSSSLTWSSCANTVATICSVVGFIEGYPKFHFMSQSLEKELGIFLKPLNYSIILPPTNVLQRLWKVPMIEGYLWGKTARERTQPVTLTFGNKDSLIYEHKYTVL